MWWRNTWKTAFEKIVFLNPSLWPYRENFARVLGVILVIGFLGLKLKGTDFSSIELSPKWVLWGLEGVILLAYLIAYIGRQPAQKVAFGFREVVFPVLVAMLPLFILIAPERWLASHLYLLPIAWTLILSGALINLVALYQLRSAFSVMAEARTLVKTGLYKHIRHPIYTGHFLLFGGMLMLHWHLETLIAYVIFVIAQNYRASIEEAKLSETFKEYQAYQKKTGKFWPHIKTIVKFILQYR